MAYAVFLTFDDAVSFVTDFVNGETDERAGLYDCAKVTEKVAVKHKNGGFALPLRGEPYVKAMGECRVSEFVGVVDFDDLGGSVEVLGWNGLSVGEVGFDLTGGEKVEDVVSVALDSAGYRGGKQLSGDRVQLFAK